MKRFVAVVLALTAALILSVAPARLAAECFTDTVTFNQSTGYSYNYFWGHCLDNLPANCNIESAQIEVRAKVWSWGWYPYEQDILVSNTLEFKYSEGYVCSLTTATHPNPGSFYKITCNLSPGQASWVLDDGCLNTIMVTFGGTYYLDYSKLTVCCGESQDPPVIDSIDFKSCISEACSEPIQASAHDPEGGLLTYQWQALDGGTIIGTGQSVAFDPPGESIYPACDPYRIKLTVTSSVSGLSAEEVISIYVKLAGDVDGDGYVTVKDKGMVRNDFGASGDPGWISSDVDCDGVVSVKDKVIIRNEFGMTGCPCP